MDLAIIILSWRSRKLAIDLINDILGWKNLNPHIIFVENEMTGDPWKDPLENQVSYEYAEENLGYGGGNNLGLNLAIKKGCRYTLVLNPDVRISETAIERLLSEIKKDENTFAIGPVTKAGADVWYGGRDIGYHSQTRLTSDDIDTNQSIIEVDYCLGSCILMSCQHLNQIGLFDVDYFFSGEVADLCMRARLNDLRCKVVLDTCIEHDEEEGINRKFMYPYYSLRNRFLYLRKFNRSLGSYLKWTWIILRNGTIHLLKGNLGLVRSHWLALSDGLWGRYGNRNCRFV